MSKVSSKVTVGASIAGTLLLLAIAAGTMVTLAGGLNPKQQFLQSVQDRDAALARNGTTKSKAEVSAAAAAASNPSSKAVRAEGILDVHQGPVPASEFAVTNQWAGAVNGSGDVWYRVFAGAYAPGQSGSGTPAVYVDTSTPTSDGYSVDIKFVGIYTLPAADSWLTITAVNGSVIDLKTESGRVYHFDLSTKQFR